MRSPASDAASDSRKRGAPSSSPGPSLRLSKKAKKQRRLGTRGAGFSAQEIDALLRLLRERLPLSKEEWEDAARVHIERFPDLDRTVDALRRKFARLHRMRPDDGNVASLPRDAQAAKAVLEAMTRRAGTTADSGAYAALLDRNDADESDDNADDVSNDDSYRVEPSAPATEQVMEPIRPLEASEVPQQAAVVCHQCRQLQQQQPRTEYDDVMAMLRLSMLQMQQQREQDAADRRRREEQERVRREEERRRREEDRAADKERMDSLLAMVAQSHKTVEMLVLALMKSNNSDSTSS